MATKKQPTSVPLAPLKSAGDQRAEAMEWNEHDRDARVRMARALRACRAHYRKVLPHHWRFMVRSFKMQMMQAAMDRKALDTLLINRGSPPQYVEIFTEYDHPSALASLHCRALNEFSTLSKGKKPYSLTVTLGDELKFTWKFTLERMREDLRDGRSAEYTLGVHSDSILSMAENGKSGFFEELGDTLRKHRREPFTRNLSEWIVRAWLPLCLWECEPDGFDAHERFCSAAELLELDFARKDNARFLVQFVDAWRNVRSKKLNQPKKLQ